MSRLIDADEMKATIKAVCCHSEDESDLLDAVEQIPSVDAVEVVHCKDCKWYKKRDWCKVPDWFCADGKEKSDE